MMRIWVLASAFIAVGCATDGNVTREQVTAVHAGMTADQVRASMGEPGDRSFRGNAQAWQYCRDSFPRDHYSTVWIVNDQVVALTNSTLSPEGPCAAYYDAIDWGQAPPDVRVTFQGDSAWLPDPPK